MFNKLFFQIGPAEAPRTCSRSAFGPRNSQYIGQHSFVTGSPGANLQWVEDFYTRTGYGRLLAWYVRNPSRPLAMLRHTLVEDAREMRQVGLSNYRREEGQPIRALTNRFAVWSGLRSGLFRRWPYHIVVWYCVFFAVAVATIRARASRAAVTLAWFGCESRQWESASSLWRR